MIGHVQSEWKLSKLISNPEKELYGIYSIVEFQLILKHERIRADRNNSFFSLILFEISSLKKKNSAVKCLISRLKQNIRGIDYIGWHDPLTIGILLPQTDFDGAVHFTEHIEDCKSILNYNLMIISYPDTNNNQNKNTDEERISELLINDFAPPIPFEKRALDIIGAIMGIIFFSPIFLILPLFIKAISPGPALYSQKRVGFQGKEFRFWKFRTMHINTNTNSHNSYLKDLINSDKPMIKLDDKCDPRIIPGGKIIRKTCLDELPQIFNILAGQMSIVGPRPCLPYEAEEYLQWHKYRFDINPGLTGLWQVS